MRLFTLILCLLLANVANAAPLSDIAKEKRWEKQIVPDLITGEAIKLKAGDVEFLALDTKAASEPAKGAVIILHGIGVHPAWPDVIEPLRTRLPEQGWRTLSIQMPILHNEAVEKDYPPLFDEVPARIQAAVDYLKSSGEKMIVVSGHSMGTAMITYYLSRKPDPAIKGFAIVSGGIGYPQDPRTNTVELIKKVHLPLLDLSGTADSDSVKEATRKRSAIFANAAGKTYKQVIVPGANHFYQGQDDALVKNVSEWLNNLAASK